MIVFAHVNILECIFIHIYLLILQNIHILGAGCGTGYHAKALVDMGFGKITLLDASPEMLAIAREKLNSAIKNNTIDRVITHQFPPFPFEDGTFDAVMFNQVSVSRNYININYFGSQTAA